MAASVPDKDGGTSADPELTTDRWSIMDGLMSMIWNYDNCFLKLVAGMHSVHPAMKSALCCPKQPIMEIRSLRSVFSAFGHKLEFGHCQLKGINNVLVLMVKEAGTERFLVHEVRRSKPDKWKDFLYHIDPAYRVFERQPNRFESYDVRSKVCWFAGEG